MYDIAATIGFTGTLATALAYRIPGLVSMDVVPMLALVGAGLHYPLLTAGAIALTYGPVQTKLLEFGTQLGTFTRGLLPAGITDFFAIAHQTTGNPLFRLLLLSVLTAYAFLLPEGMFEYIVTNVFLILGSNIDSATLRTALLQHSKGDNAALTRVLL